MLTIGPSRWLTFISISLSFKISWRSLSCGGFLFCSLSFGGKMFVATSPDVDADADANVDHMAV